MCEAGCTVWGTPDSLVPGTVGFDPKPRIFGNILVVVHVGAPFVCLGLHGKSLINQLSASHRYLRLLNQLAMISLIDGTW
jgi:hypothetical protein